jgi:hypothetical protein
LAALPDFHQATPQLSYALGLTWKYPFLTRLQYEVSFAGSATALSFSVPFGISAPAESDLGFALWEKGEFSLGDDLTHCTRFCDHPVFDRQGVYNAQVYFRESYRNQCYRPKFPRPEEGGFPHDP